uniref:(northern house mosquito) hypothetical protein n=1 Tax=Culex pipiens TaxID=7175 RepID=A0A8D8FPI6_CULPI
MLLPNIGKFHLLVDPRHDGRSRSKYPGRSGRVEYLLVNPRHPANPPQKDLLLRRRRRHIWQRSQLVWQRIRRRRHVLRQFQILVHQKLVVISRVHLLADLVHRCPAGTPQLQNFLPVQLQIPDRLLHPAQVPFAE